MRDHRTTLERVLGRRGLRAMARLTPHFHDLELGLSVDDVVADLRPGLPVGDGSRQ